MTPSPPGCGTLAEMAGAFPLCRGNRCVRSALAASAAFAALAAVVLSPPQAHAQGVEETCVLSLTEFDPGTVNVAFPDQSAAYWGGVFAAVPGTRIRMEGRFPFSRYMSWVVYDAVQRPGDGLADIEIEPKPGNANPFLAGADREARPRQYRAFIEFGPPPADPKPNTLYTGAANPASLLLYRVYIPNKGLDRTGGVGLPRVTIEPSGSPPRRGIAPVDCRRVAKPSSSAVNEFYAHQTPLRQLDGLGASGKPEPEWHKFVNIPISVADNVFGSPTSEPIREGLDNVPLRELGGSGGFLSNPDNAYVYAPISRSWGQVLVLRGRAPTFPDTYRWAPTMDDGELRYWSLCQNEPQSQRFIACLPDYRTRLDADGYYTIVISTPGQRPGNAKRGCGVNWIPWGPNSRGVLILRHMLPAPGFEPAIQFAEYDEERATMGDYLPTGEYMGKTDFEAGGC